MIATVGLISVIVTVVIVFAVQAIYFDYAEREVQRKVIQAATTDSNSKIAEQEAKAVSVQLGESRQGHGHDPHRSCDGVGRCRAAEDSISISRPRSQHRRSDAARSQ